MLLLALSSLILTVPAPAGPTVASLTDAAAAVLLCAIAGFDGTESLPSGINKTALWEQVYETIRSISPSTMISSKRGVRIALLIVSSL